MLQGEQGAEGQVLVERAQLAQERAVWEQLAGVVLRVPAGEAAVLARASEQPGRPQE
ncbi:MAG: hypothetical protein WBX11_06090 [Thiobacillaceae bacterium]